MPEILEYIFELIVLVVIGRLLSRALQSFLGAGKTPSGNQVNASRPAPRKVSTGQTARDPVCGMFVSTELSQRLSLGGKTFHFCSRECLEKFQKDSVSAHAG